MSAHAYVTQFAKMLRNLDAWIEEAVTHAHAKSFEPDVYVAARLSPDMFPFVKQVQSACDAAKFAAAYATGKPAPKHPDTETTIAELRARIATCLAFLDSLTAADYEGASDRRVAPPWLQGGWLTVDDYLLQAASPNFYFHVTTAYALLRANGVLLGKQKFIGSLPVHQP